MSIEDGMSNPNVEIIETKEEKIMGITEFVNNDAELKKIEDSIKQLKKESSTINLKIENAEYDLFMRRGRLVEQWRKKNHYS